MNHRTKADFEQRCQTHLNHLKLKCLQPKTIDACADAIRRMGQYFDHQIDNLSPSQLTDYFSDLVTSQSWSAVKLDLYGFKFYTQHVLGTPWSMPNFTKPPIFDKQGMITYLRTQFQINWMGHHGIPHWMRVRANGLMLARQNGANVHVVELFAFFHDARRVNEHRDDGHGQRGAQLAKQLRGRYFEATDQEMDLLTLACEGHSDGLLNAEVTVQTCWDSDRLDLGRVGIEPNPHYLCTEAARHPVNLNKAITRAEQWQRTYAAHL